MSPLPSFLIIVSLPLLLGSVCNAELRTWTAVNGKEVEAEFVSNEKGIVKLKLKSGKVFELPLNKLSNTDQKFLKQNVKQIESPNLDNPATRERILDEAVDRDELQKLSGNKPDLFNGVLYLPNQQKPYTGWVKDTVFVGEILLWQLKGGKDHGKTVSWYENGQKQIESHSRNGKMHGLFRSWNKEGKLVKEQTYKDGKPDGVGIAWYENGQKMEEVKYKEGKFDGVGIAWYENGQKKHEVNYKNGKKDGVLTQWHESGRKSMESHYKDGVGNDVKAWRATGELIK